MIANGSEMALHKAMLTRVLTGICDNLTLSQNLYFKGGTCASLLGYLDRFSVDLDFDIKQYIEPTLLRLEFHQVIKSLDFSLGGENDKVLEFLLKYTSTPGKRNTIKISALPNFYKSNVYEAKYISAIDRVVMCQTRETMFTHKLVALTDRHKKYGTIAGRDIYDIHHFFLAGYKYSPDLLQERTGQTVAAYLKTLISFIHTFVTKTVIDQDLNALLPPSKFQKIRKFLISETLMFLQDELSRIS